MLKQTGKFAILERLKSEKFPLPNYGGYKVGGSAPSDPIRSMAKYIQTIRRLLPIFGGWRLKG